MYRTQMTNELCDYPHQARIDVFYMAPADLFSNSTSVARVLLQKWVQFHIDITPLQ